MPKLIIGGVDYGAYPTDAGDISYDNTSSGLSATKVQGAVDELAVSGQLTYTSATTGITLNGSKVIKKGKILIISIDVVFSSDYANQWVSVLSVDTPLTIANVDNVFGVVSSDLDSISPRYCQAYQDGNYIKFRVRSPKGGNNYRGQIVIPLV